MRCESDSESFTPHTCPCVRRSIKLRQLWRLKNYTSCQLSDRLFSRLLVRASWGSANLLSPLPQITTEISCRAAGAGEASTIAASRTGAGLVPRIVIGFAPAKILYHQGMIRVLRISASSPRMKRSVAAITATAYASIPLLEPLTPVHEKDVDGVSASTTLFYFYLAVSAHYVCCTKLAIGSGQPTKRWPLLDSMVLRWSTLALLWRSSPSVRSWWRSTVNQHALPALC